MLQKQLWNSKNNLQNLSNSSFYYIPHTLQTLAVIRNPPEQLPPGGERGPLAELGVGEAVLARLAGDGDAAGVHPLAGRVGRRAAAAAQHLQGRDSTLL